MNCYKTLLNMIKYIFLIFLGLNLDPKLIRNFSDQMKNASDQDFENMKDQYQVKYLIIQLERKL